MILGDDAPIVPLKIKVEEIETVNQFFNQSTLDVLFHYTKIVLQKSGNGLE